MSVPDVVTDDLAEKVAAAEYEHDEGSTPGGWYKPWAEVDKNTHLDYVCRARAGLTAVVPLIRAQVAAEHRCVTVVEEGPPEFFIDDHDLAVIGMFEPDEPVADVVAAFEAGEKGVTRRPVSATAIRGALYDSLSPNFEIDSEGYDDAAVAVARLIDGQGRTEERERPGPGETARCPTCSRAIGVGRHGRLVSHYKPGTLARCEGDDCG